jgi:5-methylcytosine-specific restriction endonuclease McrA
MEITLERGTRISKTTQGNKSYKTEEAMAFCPQCKALQTVWLDGGALMPTRKFIQVGKNVYHNCGSRQPCRLY